jgi:hypothetical protein
MIRAVLSNIGGVVLHLDWQAAAAQWAAELALPPGGFLRAMFGGNDDTVLIGRVSEEEWWGEACQQLGVQPAEAVFIDDTRENVEAAALGMRAVLFDETRGAIEEVRRLLGDS